uniref:Uncharacterized protein n=1 Tax=Coccolithus braarudii TaxID=221442 RepID=A0A7S0PWE1_9EUKA
MFCEDSMACEFVDEFDPEVTEANLNDDVIELPFSPMRQKRTLSRPTAFEHELRVVYCQPYAHRQDRQGGGCGGDAAVVAASTRTQIAYYLPENWSASYRFTVFEDSYILRSPPRDMGIHGSDESAADIRWQLARPTSSGASALAVRPSGLPDFELVWPVPLDRMLLDAVQQACAQTQSRAKRKPHELPMAAVQQKLRKLSM